MLTKDEAMELVTKTGAFLTGHFKLTSGRHSDHYMQAAQLLMYPQYTEKLAEHLATPFKDKGVEVVIGPAMGGILVSYEVARQLGVPSLFAERENGKMTLRRNFKIEPGQKVLVVEDVITTGGSVEEVIDLVRFHGGEVVGVGVLVNRSGGKAHFDVPLQSVLDLDISPGKQTIVLYAKPAWVKPTNRAAALNY